MIFMSKFVFSVIIDYMALNSKQILTSFWNPFQSVQHTVNILKPLCAKKGEQYKTYIHSLPNPTGASVCYCSVSTCRDIKEEAMRRALQWFRDPVRQDDKKSPSALEREGKKKQTKLCSKKHSSGFIQRKCCPHGKMVKTPPCVFLVSSVFAETAFVSEFGKRNLCIFSPSPPLPLASLCPVVWWLLRSRCVWMAVITGTQVPLAHGV